MSDVAWYIAAVVVQLVILGFFMRVARRIEDSNLEVVAELKRRPKRCLLGYTTPDPDGKDCAT